MLNSGYVVTPDGVTCNDLALLFAERFPGISDERLAALVAQFIEEIPFAAALTCDGVLVPMHDKSPRIPDKVLRIVEDLKAFAGESYPAFDTKPAS